MDRPLQRKQLPVVEPPAPSLEASSFGVSSHSFARHFGDVVAILYPARPAKIDQFRWLERVLVTWSPVLSEQDMVNLRPLGERAPTGADAGTSLFARLHYVVLSRLALLVIRAPFVTVVSATGNTKFGDIEESISDARAIVEACKMMYVYYKEFAASCGMLHMANAIATVSRSSERKCKNANSIADMMCVHWSRPS